nr:phage portal protein [Acutalibacter sp. M00204]
MNIIDQVVSWFSPQRGFARQAWRDALRHYDAGDDSRLNANWRAINTSAEQTDRYSRDTVRARARDLERNSDMLNGVMGAFVRNVVGGGFTLQAETGKPELNHEIEKLWAQWCKKRNCDVTGTQSLSQMLRMAVRRKKVDGGMLFVKRYTGDGLLPFKLQAMEVDELDGSTIVAKHKGNRVCGGFEYTPYNKPVGYWFRQYSIDGITSPEPVYVEAKDVIFYFSKRRPSQLREMSDMTQTLTRIRDANEFMVSEDVKHRVQASIALAVKKVNPTGVGRTSGSLGKTYSRQMFTSGMVTELNAGDEIQLINPQGQATDAATYVKLLQRLVSSGQGLSYEAVARDMSGSTYSSTRQNLIEDGMTYADEVELLVEVIDEIYETFVISAMLAGKISAPDFWDQKEMYFAHKWVKPPKPWIDPAKEAAATKTAMQSGAKTFKQVAAENGADWRDQIDDIAEVLKYAQRQYLTPTATFPAILDNAIEKAYVTGHKQVAVTFDQWTKKGTLSDFKVHDNNYLAGPIGDFVEVPEGGELKNDRPTDAKLPTRRLKTYGKQFTLSRQTFINDDIGLVTSLPARYAAAARRTINRQCYEILMKNPKIYDDKALFSADHKNLLKTGTGITKEAVQAMIMAIST